MAINLEEIRRKHEQMNKPRGGGEDFSEKYLQLKDGETVVRILPGKSEDSQFYSETKIHRLPGEDGKDVNVHCLKVHGEECPLCELYFALYKIHNEKIKRNPELKQQGTPESKLANKIRARERYYMNAIDRSDEEKPRILSVGQILFKNIVSTMLDPDYGDVTDLKDGTDFKIIKIMEGGFPKYDQSKFRKTSSVAGDAKQIDAWMASLHDLSALPKKEDVAKVRQLAELVAVGKSAVIPKKADEVSDEEFEAKMSRED